MSWVIDGWHKRTRILEMCKGKNRKEMDKEEKKEENVK